MMRTLLCLSFVVAAFALPIATENGVLSLNRTNDNYSFNLPLTLFARDLSRASYCKEDTLKDWHCTVCTGDFVVTHVVSEEKNVAKIQAVIGYSDSQKLIVASFRGSTNLKNWIYNALVAHIDSDFNDQGCNDCKIHYGWYKAYEDIDTEVVENVKALADKFPEYTILTTGHSLGAAIAVHAALDLNVNHNLTHRLNMITFGGPRLGNEQFALFCSAMIPGSTRVVHNRDLVPHLPPKEGLFPLDFHHEAREIWNTDNEQGVKVCDGSGEDENCSKSVSLFRYSMDDHLWYLGAPHGCTTTGTLSPQQAIEMQEIQDYVINYIATHNETSTSH